MWVFALISNDIRFSDLIYNCCTVIFQSSYEDIPVFHPPIFQPSYPTPSYSPIFKSFYPLIFLSSYLPILLSSYPLIFQSSYLPILLSSYPLIFLSSNPPIFLSKPFLSNRKQLILHCIKHQASGIFHIGFDKYIIFMTFDGFG